MHIDVYINDIELKILMTILEQTRYWPIILRDAYFDSFTKHMY